MPAGADIDPELTAWLRLAYQHATRAEFLRALGRHDEARRADERALGLTGNPAERALLEQRLA